MADRDGPTGLSDAAVSGCLDGTVLAIDPGTVTGWALGSRNGRVVSGTACFRSGRFQGGGMRFLAFSTWLRDMEKRHGPLQALVYEQVRRHAGTDAAQVYGGFLAVLTSWAEERGIPYASVHVKTLKKHATGSGNASKQDMVKAARALGHAPSDDNEADAIHALAWMLETSGVTV